jgi:hypothetical protein
MAANQQASKFLKWDSNSDDGRALERMIRNNEIDTNAQPSAVLHSLGWSSRYSANAFRGAFHRLKNKVEDSQSIVPKNTAATRGKMVDCCFF